MMVPRLYRGLLLPGLTIGQQNRIITLLIERAGLQASQAGSCFSDADCHAANILSRYASDESIETRAALIGRACGVSYVTAAALIGFALGLRLGLPWGRYNFIRERSEANARKRERAEQKAAPPFDPVAAQADIDAAKRWSRAKGNTFSARPSANRR